MPFDISALRMHLECFAHEQNIPTSYKNVPKYLECTQNSVRMFRMHFEYSRIYLHSDGIPAHSDARVTRV